MNFTLKVPNAIPSSDVLHVTSPYDGREIGTLETIDM